jgi:hypothetical protein
VYVFGRQEPNEIKYLYGKFFHIGFIDIVASATYSNIYIIKCEFARPTELTNSGSKIADNVYALSAFIQENVDLQNDEDLQNKIKQIFFTRLCEEYETKIKYQG